MKLILIVVCFLLSCGICWALNSRFASSHSRIITAPLAMGPRPQGKNKFKVSLIGASGGIGQPLSLLLQSNPYINRLSLYDLQSSVTGVAKDLSHCSCSPFIEGFHGTDQLPTALKNSDVVVITAGIPRKPGMSRDDLFKTNAQIVSDLAGECSKHCPDSTFLIISNPVNSLVPLFAEVLKSKGCYNPSKLIGVTTLDVVRANTFVAQHRQSVNMESQSLSDVSHSPYADVTVIGGHAGTTIIPLLSQITNFHPDENSIKSLTHRIQFGGDEVVAAKDGQGSATLSMAFAGSKFVSSLLQGMSGVGNVVECAFVENDLTAAPFFATKALLGANGVERVLPFGDLSHFERDMLNDAIPVLIQQADKGVQFVKKS